jgi:hypothetical protein
MPLKPVIFLLAVWPAALLHAATPTLTTVNPSSGVQGKVGLSVALTGTATHWVQGTTTVSFGAGITVTTLTVSSATSATAVLTIAATAAAGARNVTATTGTEVATLANGFTVTSFVPTVSYTYDSQGRVATATYATVTGSVTVTYSYDAAGNRTSVVTK